MSFWTNTVLCCQANCRLSEGLTDITELSHWTKCIVSEINSALLGTVGGINVFIFYFAPHTFNVQLKRTTTMRSAHYTIMIPMKKLRVVLWIWLGIIVLTEGRTDDLRGESWGAITSLPGDISISNISYTIERAILVSWPIQLLGMD